MLALKRMVSVTLDIMCYDDLDVEHMDWKELLELEGDEDVHCSIKEYDPFQSVPVRRLDLILNSIRLIDSQQQNLIENEDSRETGTDPLAILLNPFYITFVPDKTT